MWGFNLGALGIGGGDAYATLGATYGVGAGLQVSMNLAHTGVGLLNVETAWHFIDTRYFDLGARVGFWYGHGEWFWILRGATKSIASRVDVINVPVELTASAPVTRFLELDLGVQYAFASLFGSGSSGDSVFVDTELGVRQFFFRPGARWFISDNTALEVFAKLPAYSAVPLKRRTIELPFSDTWQFEGGLRSRFTEGFFGSVRVHYGDVANVLYGARVYPSFELELRL
jgi:hypothetical protein